MKYSILGFNQEEVLKCKTTIDVNGKEKEVCIDVGHHNYDIAPFFHTQHFLKISRLCQVIQGKVHRDDVPDVEQQGDYGNL